VLYDAYSGADPAPTKCSSCTFVVSTGTYATRVKNIVAYGCDSGDATATGGCTQVPVVEGVDPSKVTVTLNIANWKPVSVAVAITDVTLPTPVGRVVLNGKPVTTFPYVGAYMAPPPS
jgi:hypothetical protein